MKTSSASCVNNSQRCYYYRDFDPSDYIAAVTRTRLRYLKGGITIKKREAVRNCVSGTGDVVGKPMRKAEMSDDVASVDCTAAKEDEGKHVHVTRASNMVPTRTDAVRAVSYTISVDPDVARGGDDDRDQGGDDDDDDPPHTKEFEVDKDFTTMASPSPQPSSPFLPVPARHHEFNTMRSERNEKEGGKDEEEYDLFASISRLSVDRGGYHEEERRTGGGSEVSGRDQRSTENFIPRHRSKLQARTTTASTTARIAQRRKSKLLLSPCADTDRVDQRPLMSGPDARSILMRSPPTPMREDDVVALQSRYSPALRKLLVSAVGEEERSDGHRTHHHHHHDHAASEKKKELIRRKEGTDVEASLALLLKHQKVEGTEEEACRQLPHEKYTRNTPNNHLAIEGTRTIDFRGSPMSPTPMSTNVDDALGGKSIHSHDREDMSGEREERVVVVDVATSAACTEELYVRAADDPTRLIAAFEARLLLSHQHVDGIHESSFHRRGGLSEDQRRKLHIAIQDAQRELLFTERGRLMRNDD